VAALVDGMVPGISTEARDAIVARATGIPLYAVEMVRMLSAGGDLVAEGDRYEFTGDIASLAVPESLQAVIGARLDRLDPEDRVLLQDCSIVGHSFTIDGVAHITGIDEDDLKPRLAVLVAAELLEVNRDPRSPERGQFQFIQSLIREVAHGRISREVRKERHLQVAAYLETLGPELAPIVASHYLDAYAAASGEEAEELRVKARDSLLAASDRAAELHSAGQARSLAESALGTTVDDAECAPILERIAAAANWMADRDVAVENAQRAMAWYRSVEDTSGEYRAARLLGHIHNDGNQSGRAIDLLEPLLAGADLSTDPNLAVAAATLTRAYLLDGRGAELAATMAETALAALEPLQLTEAIADAMISRGTMLGDMGRPRQGIALIRGGIDLADQGGYTATSIRGRINLGYVGVWEDPELGLPVALEALDIARRAGQQTMVLFLTYTVAWWYWVMGDLNAAEDIISDDVMDTAPSEARGQMLLHRAVISRLRGNHVAAAEFFDEAEHVLSATEDAQVRIFLEIGRHPTLSAGARFAEAFETSMALTRSNDFNSIIQVEEAKNAALWTGNTDWLEEVIGIYRDVGAAANVYRRLTEAALAVIEDPSREALDEAQAALAECDRRGQAYRYVMLPAALALHLPPGPDRHHWRDELRIRCDKWGYAGIWDQYERLAAQEQ